MIGAAAYYEYKGNRSGWDLNAVPNLKLGKDNRETGVRRNERTLHSGRPCSRQRHPYGNTDSKTVSGITG